MFHEAPSGYGATGDTSSRVARTTGDNDVGRYDSRRRPIVGDPAGEELMNRRRAQGLAAAALALLAAGGIALLSRGSDDDRPTAAPPSASSSPIPVLVPGRPGESAMVTDSDKVQLPAGTEYNTIDVTYVQMMIAHHEQAVRMADLAPGRAANAGVLGIAGRISAAQKPEIVALRSWLRDRGQPESDPKHDHATMPGMQSESEVTALAAAKGADFDRRFVAMMTEHHEGAQQMATDLLRGGADQRLSELANETAVEQVTEIRRMADLNVT
ncbi:DUF305 domain-containing protein [Actinoplanes sp. NPDC024001]|uniref:DUF305 domain-containing protein n=1 Tax=Actinoplanes sp. NPDC024001 TaxID=3154598 RepID=UPI0033EA1C6B